MANLELRERLLGDGYTGRVDVRPGLSWADRRVLEGAAAGAMQSAVELRHVNESMSRLEQGVHAIAATNEMVAGAVLHLERELGLQLDAQTDVLVQQLGALAQLNETLRTPAKTRAAERVAQVGELLRGGRWERALKSAEDAIEDDATNPSAFTGAGWAALGLGRIDEARDRFIEAAQAANGDLRAQAIRQAARLDFVSSGATTALERLNYALDDLAGEMERRAVDYDRALYLAEAGDVDGGRAALESACGDDDRFCLWALHDEVVNRYEGLREVAVAELSRIIDSLRREREDAERALADIDQTLAEAQRLTADAESLLIRTNALAEQPHIELSQQARLLQDELRDLGPAATRSLMSLLSDLREVKRKTHQLRDNVEEVVERLQLEYDRLRVLEEAVEELCEEERAEVLDVGDSHVTVGRTGLLRYQVWTLTVDEDARVTIFRGAAI